MRLFQRLFKKPEPSFHFTVKSIVLKEPFDEQGVLEAVMAYFSLEHTTRAHVLAVCQRERIPFVTNETRGTNLIRDDFYRRVNAKAKSNFDSHLVCCITIFNFRILTTTENYIGFYFRDGVLVEIAVSQNGLEI